HITVKMNFGLLEQAIVNLIDNAIKYSNPNSSVEIIAERREHWCVIDVKDYGCGISEEHLPRLFERFYRVDKARSRKLGGTGLGLSIVKHIVRIHRGKVGVKSTPKKGSTFSIYLPI
ncbi:MAG: PAS domain-containing sensor histidine kinase, partial [Nitrospirae bacterium]